MKKSLVISVITVMLLAITVNVCAAGLSLRGANAAPTLIFDGGTAKCIASINEADKWISVTMELWQGNKRLKTWTKAKMGNVTLNEKYSGVVSGQTYTLKVYGTSGGVAFSLPSTSRTA